MRNFIDLKHVLLVILCCALIMPNVVAAQQEDEIPPLSKTYIAEDKSFSFSYPQNWEITLEGEGVVTFRVPLASSGEPNSQGIGIESGQMSITISIDEEPGQTPEEVVLAQADFFAAGDSFELTEVESDVRNGRPIAFVAVVSDFLPLTNGFYAIDLANNNDLFMNFWLAGTDDQVRRIFPVMVLIFGTLQMPANAVVTTGDLSQTFEAAGWGITFDYPEGWTADEQPNYILLTAPNSVTVGISASTPQRGEPADLEALVTERGEAFIQALSEASDDPLDIEVQMLTINDLPASRVDYTDGNFQYSFFSVAVTPDLIATVTVIGDASGVQEIEESVSGIANSLRELGAASSPAVNSGSDDELLTYTEPNNLVAFEYPAAWELVEEERFTKLRLPGDMVIDIAILPLNVSDVGDDPAYNFGLRLLERLQQDDPGLTEKAIERITIGDYEAVQLEVEIPADAVAVRNVVINLGQLPSLRSNETAIVLIIIAGDIGEFTPDDPAIQAFLESLHPVE